MTAFIINYADQAKNDLDIAGLESGEYSEFVPELYQGIEKSVCIYCFACCAFRGFDREDH